MVCQLASGLIGGVGVEGDEGGVCVAADAGSEKVMVVPFPGSD